MKCVFKIGSFKTLTNSSLLRMSFESNRELKKLGSTRARAKLLNFLICDQSRVQILVC
jgi:hypothetical protein